jgi:ATP-dependent Clp protease ATP-binding subunit ClpC
MGFHCRLICHHNARNARIHPWAEVRHNDRVFERFTDEARRVIVMAQDEAREMPHNYIGTEHLLLGLLRTDESVGFWALNDVGITLDSARRSVLRIVGPGEQPYAHIPFTERSKKVLENALRVSTQRSNPTIGSGDILLGVLQEPESVGVQVIRDHDVDVAVLEQKARAAMNHRNETRTIQEEPPMAATDQLYVEMAMRLDKIEAKLDEVLRQLRRSS